MFGNQAMWKKIQSELEANLKSLKLKVTAADKPSRFSPNPDENSGDLADSFAVEPEAEGADDDILSEAEARELRAAIDGGSELSREDRAKLIAYDMKNPLYTDVPAGKEHKDKTIGDTTQFYDFNKIADSLDDNGKNQQLKEFLKFDVEQYKSDLLKQDPDADVVLSAGDKLLGLYSALEMNMLPEKMQSIVNEKLAVGNKGLSQELPEEDTILKDVGYGEQAAVNTDMSTETINYIEEIEKLTNAIRDIADPYSPASIAMEKRIEELRKAQVGDITPLPSPGLGASGAIMSHNDIISKMMSYAEEDPEKKIMAAFEKIYTREMQTAREQIAWHAHEAISKATSRFSKLYNFDYTLDTLINDIASERTAQLPKIIDVLNIGSHISEFLSEMGIDYDVLDESRSVAVKSLDAYATKWAEKEWDDYVRHDYNNFLGNMESNVTMADRQQKKRDIGKQAVQEFIAWWENTANFRDKVREIASNASTNAILSVNKINSGSDRVQKNFEYDENASLKKEREDILAFAKGLAATFKEHKGKELEGKGFSPEEVGDAASVSSLTVDNVSDAGFVESSSAGLVIELVMWVNADLTAKYLKTYQEQCDAKGKAYQELHEQTPEQKADYERKGKDPDYPKEIKEIVVDLSISQLERRKLVEDMLAVISSESKKNAVGIRSGDFTYDQLNHVVFDSIPECKRITDAIKKVYNVELGSELAGHVDSMEPYVNTARDFLYGCLDVAYNMIDKHYKYYLDAGGEKGLASNEANKPAYMESNPLYPAPGHAPDKFFMMVDGKLKMISVTKFILSLTNDPEQMRDLYEKIKEKTGLRMPVELMTPEEQSASALREEDIKKITPKKPKEKLSVTKHSEPGEADRSNIVYAEFTDDRGVVSAYLAIPKLDAHAYIRKAFGHARRPHDAPEELTKAISDRDPGSFEYGDTVEAIAPFPAGGVEIGMSGQIVDEAAMPPRFHSTKKADAMDSDEIVDVMKEQAKEAIKSEIPLMSKYVKDLQAAAQKYEAEKSDTTKTLANWENYLIARDRFSSLYGTIDFLKDEKGNIPNVKGLTELIYQIASVQVTAEPPSIHDSDVYLSDIEKRRHRGITERMEHPESFDGSDYATWLAENPQYAGIETPTYEKWVKDNPEYADISPEDSKAWYESLFPPKIKTPGSERLYKSKLPKKVIEPIQKQKDDAKALEDKKIFDANVNKAKKDKAEQPAADAAAQEASKKAWEASEKARADERARLLKEEIERLRKANPKDSLAKRIVEKMNKKKKHRGE